MPTEQLFGAYHFVMDDSGKTPADKFDFTARDDGDTQAGLLLPAVQKAKAEPASVKDFDSSADDDGAVEFTLVELLEVRSSHRVDDGGGGGWIDILSMNEGVNRSGDDGDFMF